MLSNTLWRSTKQRNAGLLNSRHFFTICRTADIASFQGLPLLQSCRWPFHSLKSYYNTTIVFIVNLGTGLYPCNCPFSACRVFLNRVIKMLVLHSSGIQLWEYIFWINLINSLCSANPPYFNRSLYMPSFPSGLLFLSFLMRFVTISAEISVSCIPSISTIGLSSSSYWFHSMLK